MLDLTVTIHACGPVPATTAWERYDRPDLWPTWSPQLTSVTVDGRPRRTGESAPSAGTSPDRLSAGLTGRVHGPLGVWAHFTVLGVDEPGMGWAWRVSRGSVAVRLDHRVEARHDGSRTSLTLRGPAPLVIGYVPLAWYALHRLVTLA